MWPLDNEYITGFDILKDGGSVVIYTILALPYVLDYRIGSETKGKWYFGYPRESIKPIDTSLPTFIEFLESLRVFKDKINNEYLNNVLRNIWE